MAMFPYYFVLGRACIMMASAINKIDTGIEKATIAANWKTHHNIHRTKSLLYNMSKELTKVLYLLFVDVR